MLKPNFQTIDSFSPAHLPTVYKERIKGHKFRNIKTLFQIIEEIDVYNTIPLCVSLNLDHTVANPNKSTLENKN